MATRRHTLKSALRHLSPTLRRRGSMLKIFSDMVGLVYFGSVHQHDDEYDAIRGFTASLNHRDSHFAVGTYDGYNIRIVDRYDVVRVAGQESKEQLWTIIEIELETKDIPHLFFIPTGQSGGEYARLFATQPHMHPLNSANSNHSPEFYGRYQILTRATHSLKVESLFTSPMIVGISSRFWPRGIEIEHGKLLIYINERRLEKTALELTLTSALWLAEMLDESLDT